MLHRKQINYPSVRRIQSVQNIDLDVAKTIRKVMEADTHEAVCELSRRASDYVRSCYHRPALSHVKMYAIDELFESYGVEYIGKGYSQKSPAIEYCNSGDGYNPTVMLVNGRFRVGCWADIVERGNYA